MNLKKTRRLSLTSKIIIGVVLGIIAGLFFGERIQPITIIGDVFIMLLQMPVLPYVFLSLIIGIGSFNLKEGGRLAKSLVVIMLVLWILTLIPICLLPLTFPDWESASFFSSTQVQEPSNINFLDLYITTNPFHALSNSIVPAVVLFSIILGVALSTMSSKHTVIKVLNPIMEALGKITNWVVEFAPYGVFALVAGLAGSMDPEVFSKLEIFIWGYAALALLLSFWILPGLIMAFTPFTYRQIIRQAKDALVTGFATGNLFVILPMLADKSKQILEEHRLESDKAVDVIVPTAFSFPSSGKLLALSFVLFAGWYSGFEVSVSDYPTFLLAGTFSFFGSTVTAIPFMLDLLQIPSDLMQLFLPLDNIITNRFGVLVAAVFILALTLLGVAANTGTLQFSSRKMIRYLGISLTLLAVILMGLRFLLGLKKAEYTRDKEMVQMFISRSSVPNKVFIDSIPPVSNNSSLSRLDNIRQRGYISVGFLRDHMPNAFINESGDLVGSDIEMAHVLAEDLNVSLRFIRIEAEKIPYHLERGDIDILMTGIAVVLDKPGKVAFTIPYQDHSLAFIVKDHLRGKYTDLKMLRDMDTLRLGISQSEYYTNKLSKLLPNAEIILLNSPRLFFRESVELDALAFTAESGGAWTIIYPQFSVAVPKPQAFKVPHAYVVSRDDQEFLNFINTWILLKKADGTFDSAFKYWEMGRGIEEIKEPRWSVIRNVLHWLE
jgi:Na+/H+-dicarboxylate symporter/ABC-type amino acid transport substrate-binding protein